MTTAADRNLAPGQFRDLNREFYRADPADYLQRRVRAVIMSISDSPAIKEALVQGVKYGETEIRRDPDHEDDTKAAQAYASLESTNLLHHATECLLRLYFAHADQRPCPWLEIARLRRPRDFKERVEQLRDSLGEQKTIDSLRTIFFGNTRPEPLGWDHSEEVWQRKTDGLLMLVGYVCNRALNDAALYNAAKHGLAVVGGNPGLFLSAPDAGLSIATEGPALTYLDLTRPDDPRGRQWTKNLAFVQIEANLGLTEIVGLYIRGMWGIARYRYLGATDEPPQIMLIEPDTLRKIIKSGRGDEPFGFLSMTQTLGYYADGEPERPLGSQSTRSETGEPA
jgi:hypothetical protein